MDMQQPILRPLNTGEILDRAFRLYRAHFWLFIGIGGVLLGPLLVLKLLSQLFFHDTNIVNVLESFLTAYGLQGALIWAAANTYLGKPVTLNGSYSVSGRYIGKFFGSNFVQGLAYIPGMIVVAVLYAIFLGTGNAGETLLGFTFILLIAVPYIFFFTTRWWFSLPAIMLEGLNSIDGLRRSWALTAQSFWHVAGVSIASGLLAYVISAVPAALIVFFMQMFPTFNEIGTFSALVIGQLGSLITLPLSVGILVIAYYDMRVRREGFDLQLELETAQQTETTGEETALVD